MMLKKDRLKQIAILQGIILIYTLSTVAAKFASGYDFLSKGFVISYGIEILILGIYAILWQQIIKKFDISIAYANKAAGIFWSIVWAILFFKEEVTWKNILGIVVIFIGIMVVDTDDSE